MLQGQDFAVFALVIGAAAYLVRNWFGAEKGSGCGKCGGCESAPKTEAPLVQIDLGGNWNG